MFELFGAYTTSVAIGITSDVAARVQQKAVEKVNGNILILLLQSVSYLAATMVRTHSPSYSLTHLLTHSPNHLLTHPLTHSPTHLGVGPLLRQTLRLLR